MMPRKGPTYSGPHDYSYPGQDSWRTGLDREITRASGPPSGWSGSPRAESIWLLDAHKSFEKMNKPKGGVYPGGYYG